MSILGNSNFIDLSALLILAVMIFSGAVGASAVILEGTPTADNLTGTSFDDFLSGGGGPDHLYGGNGNDEIDGREGSH